jgi:hypothetical protein
MRKLEFMKDYDGATRARVEFERHLARAKARNSQMIDRLFVMQSAIPWGSGFPISPPRGGSAYPRFWR